MATPFVTVLVDTFNHGRFIEAALESVLAQDFPAAEREILVVDDGSTDRTPHVLEKFSSHIHILRKANGGQASAFNAAIPEARGQIIALLDGDDWWGPGKLSAVAAAGWDDPDLGLVGHSVTEVYSDGSRQTEILREHRRLRVDSPANARLFRLRKSFFGTSRMTLRASVARTLLPVPESLVVEADEYLFTLAAVAADADILPQPLTFYRIHDSNLYQSSSYGESCVRRKQRVLAALALGLASELPRRGLDPESTRILTEIVETEVAQLRLMLDGGLPWKTPRVEWMLYRIQHAAPPVSHRAFKLLTLFPALFLPPRFYYSCRRALVGSGLYRRLRHRIFPVPQPAHVVRSSRAPS
jgi:hypothetical protein